MIIREVIRARGHENIKALHKSTIEITRENYLTPRGDCIVGIKSDKAIDDLDPLFKEYLKREDTMVIVVFETDNIRDVVLAQGSPNLLLSDRKRVVIRKSSFIDHATLCIKANKSAADLDRKLVEKLRNRDTELFIKIYLLNIKELEYGELFSNKSVRKIE